MNIENRILSPAELWEEKRKAFLSDIESVIELCNDKLLEKYDPNNLQTIYITPECTLEVAEEVVRLFKEKNWVVRLDISGEPFQIVFSCNLPRTGELLCDSQNSGE